MIVKHSLFYLFFHFFIGVFPKTGYTLYANNTDFSNSPDISTGNTPSTTTSCVAVDLCKEHVCPESADCSYLGPGEYKCTCKTGYAQVGDICQGSGWPRTTLIINKGIFIPTELGKKVWLGHIAACFIKIPPLSIYLINVHQRVPTKD